MTSSNYPRVLDVFMQLVDGLHAITGDDFNVLMDAMEKIQVTLGYGAQASSVTDFGPKGGAANVAERLAALFSTTESTINDFAFVTGTVELGALSEGTDANGQLGLMIPYGVTMSGPDVVVLFGTSIPGDEVDGTKSENATGSWWVTLQSPTSVWIQARLANAEKISPDNSTTVNYGLLAFGPKAYY